MQPSRLLLLLLIVLLGLGLPEVAGLRSLQETETESNAEAESESETERDSDSDGGSSSGRPHAAANTVCGPSLLGYQCYRQVCSGIQLHWSLGGPPPSNSSMCSYSTPSLVNSSGATDIDADTIHMALVTDWSGYVSLALTSKAGRMVPSDAIIGWVDKDTGVANVAAYHIKGYSGDPRMGQIYVDPNVVISNVGASLGDEGNLTLCFSRPVASVGGAGVDMKAGLADRGGVSMNFVASHTSGIHHHEMDWSHLCGVDVGLVAISKENGGGVVPPQVTNYKTAVNAHGALMIIAWLGFVPAGILAARYRWTTQAHGSPNSAWFQVHRTVQIFGILIFIAAYFIPFATFGGQGSAGKGGVVEAHGAIALTVAVITGVHVMSAFIRPKPNTSYRLLFNYAHHWAGRTLLALAVVNVFLGVQAFHLSFGRSRFVWYLLLSIIVSLWIALFAFLEQRNRRLGNNTHIVALPLATNEPRGGLGSKLVTAAKNLMHRESGVGEEYRMMREGQGASELSKMAVGPPSTSF